MYRAYRAQRNSMPDIKVWTRRVPIGSSHSRSCRVLHILQCVAWMASLGWETWIWAYKGVVRKTVLTCAKAYVKWAVTRGHGSGTEAWGVLSLYQDRRYGSVIRWRSSLSPPINCLRVPTSINILIYGIIDFVSKAQLTQQIIRELGGGWRWSPSPITFSFISVSWICCRYLLELTTNQPL